MEKGSNSIMKLKNVCVRKNWYEWKNFIRNCEMNRSEIILRILLDVSFYVMFN